MCHSLLICTIEIVNLTFKPYQRITGSLADPVILWPRSKCSFSVKPQLRYMEFCVYHVMLFDILDVMRVKWRSWTTCPICWTFVPQSLQKTPNKKYLAILAILLKGLLKLHFYFANLTEFVDTFSVRKPWQRKKTPHLFFLFLHAPGPTCSSNLSCDVPLL